MKILHLTPSYKPAFIYGGPTMSVGRLCEALQQEANLDIEVYCTRANGSKELPIPSGKAQIVDGVKVTYFNRVTKDHTHFSPELLIALWKKIKEEKKSNPDQFIVHIHSWWNLVVMFGAFIAKLQNVPIVLSPRGMVTNYTQTNKNSLVKKVLHALLGKNMLKNVHVLTTSQKEEQDYLTICKPLSINTLPNIVDLPINLPQKSNIDSPLFKLLFLSRIEPKKGLDLLIQALAQVEFSWSLSIAGTGDQHDIESLKTQVNNLGLTAKIHWLGHQDNSQKYDIIAAHDLFCLSSYNENFANVVIESLAVGTPVLISDQVGLADYVSQNNLGFITSLHPEAITATLNQAYQAKDLRLSIQNQAPKLIQADFQANHLAKKYVSYYQKIIG